MDEITATADEKRAERQAILENKRDAIEQEKRAMEDKIRALVLLEQELKGVDNDNDEYFRQLQGRNGGDDGHRTMTGAMIVNSDQVRSQ